MQQVCFRLTGTRSGRDAPATRPADPVPLGLTSRQSDAFAELLQVFACGEESAALAFAHLAGTQAEAATRSALETIAGEEEVHEVLLRELRHALPDPSLDPELRRTLIRFYGHLRFGDAGRHLAAIAALDSGVCAIVAACLRPGAPLAEERRTAPVFSRIHREEAGHVRLSRVLARELVGTAAARDVAAEVRNNLIDLLGWRSAAFEALGVDADRLFGRLRSPPAALFA